MPSFVEEVAWMLAIERGDELAGVEVGERHQLGAGVTESLLHERVHVSSLGLVDAAAQDGGDLQFHLGAPALDDHLRHRLRTRIEHGVSVASRDGVSDRRGDPPQVGIDGGEGRLAVRDRQERQVEVD